MNSVVYTAQTVAIAEMTASRPMQEIPEENSCDSQK